MRVVTGAAKGRRLKGPKTPGTRPIIDRVKTALFDILSWRVEEVRFLDLFAGTGGVGIEALSRGAAHVTFIEMSMPIIKLIRENLQITALSRQAEVLHMNSFKFLHTHTHTGTENADRPTNASVHVYDMIYVAPPQYQEMAARALGLLDTSPLLATEGMVIVQIHPKERAGVAAVALSRLVQTDERRYGSTLLMFYKIRQIVKEELPYVDTPSES
ncbi:MAG: 16S rRNA (guanine(966)-N(2))-methyltransferase RsmD [Ktedonobacteraceae bacterium]